MNGSTEIYTLLQTFKIMKLVILAIMITFIVISVVVGVVSFEILNALKNINRTIEKQNEILEE
jgi:hypothetical protein